MATNKLKISMSMLISLLVLNLALVSQPSYADNAEAVCERPVFKLWKAQQSNRLWEPTEETLAAEKTGKVFTYNCFTEEEIDIFFSSHGDRIENAHFYPILSNTQKRVGEPQEEEGC